MASLQEDAYCTLLMSDEYLPGAAVLAHSLRDAGTQKKLAVLVTLDSLSADTLTELKSLYDHVIPVNKIANPTPANLYLMGRGDLSFAFTKLSLWRQHRFRKLIYLDADIVVLRAPDELFDLDTSFAAVPDVGWPDAFNTGVMVLKPDMGEYLALQTMASTGDSFDGADQGLLNQYYQHRDWHRLSFRYNCTPNAQYQWEPAYRYFKSNISMVHFIGKSKPWFQGRQNTKTGPGTYNELLARWWAVYDRHYKAPTLPYNPNRSSTYLRIVQSHVVGEATSVDHGYPALVAQQSAVGESEPEAPITTTEQPFTDPGERVENIQQGAEQPVPTVEQRRFSAPYSEWDATRMPPPTASKPEAANFPAQTYAFNESNELFQPPRSYPEPPKDMWYQVPREPPSPAAKPRAIFPWEERSENVRPTRVFSEDKIPDPEPTPPMTAGSEAEEPSQPLTPSTDLPSDPASSIPDEPFASFSPKNVNAWDNHPGIDSYTRAFETAIFRRRGGGAAIPKPTDILATTTTAADPSSPPSSSLNPSNPTTTTTSPSSTTTTHPVHSPTPTRSPHRRESLILTDFPSATERPSLPVTPMPIRRPTFWGTERDAQGLLPGAEGVPDQADWDPEEQLENLRRLSLVTAEEAARRLSGNGGGLGVGGERGREMGREMPRRGLVGSSALPGEGAAVGVGEMGAVGRGGGRGGIEKIVVPPLSGGGSPHGLTASSSAVGPNFGSVDFGGIDGGATRPNDEDVEPGALSEGVETQ